MYNIEFIQFILFVGTIICLCIGVAIHDLINLLFY